MTTAADVKTHKATGSWRALETLAAEIVRDASSRAKIDLKPVLGGGTRLMLAMEHRISDDIDLFIRDPQWIGYLTPRLNDRFKNVISGYDESPTSLKLKVPSGEIDFIVRMSLLGLPNDSTDDCAFALVPIAEVLAKKLFYRGWALTPSDLFDWRSIETRLPAEVIHAQELAKLISSRIDQMHAALFALEQSAMARLAWSAIRAPDLIDFDDSIKWAHSRLQEFRHMREHTIAPSQSAAMAILLNPTP